MSAFRLRRLRLCPRGQGRARKTDRGKRPDLPGLAALEGTGCSGGRLPSHLQPHLSSACRGFGEAPPSLPHPSMTGGSFPSPRGGNLPGSPSWPRAEPGDPGQDQAGAFRKGLQHWSPSWSEPGGERGCPGCGRVGLPLGAAVLQGAAPGWRSPRRPAGWRSSHGGSGGGLSGGRNPEGVGEAWLPVPR